MTWISSRSSASSARDGEQRLAVEDDAIGHLAEPVAVALGEGPAVVEPEEIERPVFGAVFDDEHDVVETVDHVIGQLVELVDDDRLERFGIEFHDLLRSGVSGEPRTSSG